MASLTKDPRGWSKYWIGCYTAADGRQVKRSTRQTDKRKALAIVREWEELESLGKEGLLTSEEQFRRVFTQAFQRITGKKLHEFSVREWLERWLAGEKGAVSEATFTKYSGIVRGFLAFLSTRAGVRLEAITTEDFARYRDQLLAEGRSPRTVNVTIRKILKRPFTVAVHEGYLERNPVQSIRHLVDVRVERGVFSPEQITRLLETAPGDWRGFILAAYYTGARMGDIARLKWEAVDLAERSISFYEAKHRNRKEARPKIKLPIHAELLEYLLTRSVPDDGGAPLFPELFGRSVKGKTGLSATFKKLMEQARIDAGVARARVGQAGRSVSSLSFHSLRHSFTSALANAGVPPELRQKLTGHADARTHSLYTHHEFEKVREALSLLGSLPKPGEGK